MAPDPSRGRKHPCKGLKRIIYLPRFPRKEGSDFVLINRDILPKIFFERAFYNLGNSSKKMVTFFSGDLQWEDEEKQKKFLPGR
ncbi:hypothetical protein BREVNS_0912 [Brevinematales bacterium NS]|nr:hypothetical protein BREVNS_0912 [Brevinematales bacterium NS]